MCKGILKGSMIAAVLVAVLTSMYSLLKAYVFGGCSMEVTNMLFNVFTIAFIFLAVDCTLLAAWDKVSLDEKE